MISTPLFVNTVKRNYKLLMIFLCVLVFYLAVIVMLFDPADPEQIKNLFAILGDTLNDVFGFSVESFTSVLYYISSTFFGILLTGFSMVYYVMLTNNLINKPIDNGSLSYTLSMPITRRKYIVTQLSYMYATLLVMYVVILSVGAVCMSLIQSYDFLAYLDLVSISFAVIILVATISFTLAVIFSGSKLASLSTYVPIILLLVNMLGGAVQSQAPWVCRISPFGWVDQLAVVNGDQTTWWLYIVIIAVTALLSVACVKVFQRKRLAI